MARASQQGWLGRGAMGQLAGWPRPLVELLVQGTICILNFCYIGYFLFCFVFYTFLYDLEFIHKAPTFIYNVVMKLYLKIEYLKVK